MNMFHGSLGPLPVDVVAHFLVGALIYSVLRAIGQRPSHAFISVFSIAVFKELIIDPKLVGWVLESVKDVTFTLVGAALTEMFARASGAVRV